MGLRGVALLLAPFLILGTPYQRLSIPCLGKKLGFQGGDRVVSHREEKSQIRPEGVMKEFPESPPFKMSPLGA